MSNYANLKTTLDKITCDDVICRYLHNLVCKSGDRLEFLYSIVLMEGDGNLET